MAANKYGYDIENPMTWFLYEKSQPELRALDPVKVALNQERLDARRQWGHKTNVGEWLMTLPFSLTPAKVPVNVTAPNYYYFRNHVSGYSGPKQLINTKARYTSRHVVIPEGAPNAAYPETSPQFVGQQYPSASGLASINMNVPPPPRTTFSLKRRLPAIELLTPERKLAILAGLIQGGVRLGSHLTPEPIKRLLPPPQRGLLHYLSGRGTPSDLNLDYDYVMKRSRFMPYISPALEAESEVSGIGNALRKAMEHPEISRLVGDRLGVVSARSGYGETDLVENSLGNFFHLPPLSPAHTPVIFDDYRFYPLGRAHPNKPTPASTIWRGVKHSVKPLMQGVGWPNTLEEWLSTIGTPFPVVIRPKKK